MFYIISYDIPDDRRRNKLAKVLKGYGTRVQFSVFEAHLNKTQFEELKHAVNGVIDPSQDSVRYYTLCSNCIDRIEESADGEVTSDPKQLSSDKQLPDLTPHQVRSRCTEQSYERGVAYFFADTISNQVLQDWTLSARCEGSDIRPYRTSAELDPSGIAATRCSCPYDWEGDCKHIVALLLTYIEAPETIRRIGDLLAALALKPKSDLLQIISELLKRNPELVPIVQMSAEGPDTPPHPGQLRLVEVYKARIDQIFGSGFLEQYQLRDVLVQLEKLVQHAESLAQVGETEFALAILHALIHQSIVRYADTLQRGEVPQFVNKCTKAFVQIATNGEEQLAILEYCRLLLQLSFDAEQVFTPVLTHLIAELCLTQDTTDLQLMIAQHLDACLDRQAYVRLLLALYLRAGKIDAYLRLARSEREYYLLVHTLFTCQKDDAAWKALQEYSLSVDEHWALLKSPSAKRIPNFTDKLLTLLSHHDPNTAVPLYHKLIEQNVLTRKRENYEKVREYLTALKTLYQRCHQENQWDTYLLYFYKQHVRKRLLLEIIDGVNLP